MNGEGLVRLRGILMGFAGVVCLAYGVLAVVMGRPDPMPQYIPGVAGIAAMVAIYLAFWQAGSDSRKAASDEMFVAEMNGAVKVGFWVGIFMYPAFAPFLIAGWTTFDVAFAAMGTLMAAAYLLTFAVSTLRGL
ncbi:hypothetical protein [Amylibacter sp. IMCC11727]|uniref:hypothetical protein n=1 Tax=Amylibacter sp. IMCC11727 TaxID=3039851 RepID=UPI00244E0449|nr:hypothetical protein [Amylibacter sp. IMCC11727]WGI20889.1 hypothetical protein QBD29_12305 [Amylibacter sp. IMCC11727]